MIEWKLADRASMVGFAACLAAATVLVVPLFAGEESVVLMIAVLVLVSQAWRLGLARYLHARLDTTGITKELGPRKWRLAWADVSEARLITLLGSTQLVLTTADVGRWSISDRLAGRIGVHARAVQVPTDQLPAVRQLLSEHGLTPA
ncbi:MAG TPA: hypothetical protein VGK18_12850 [Propionicimonas sp.]|jgi:hypothetical protein|uniref:hypothetical protein n=1 Tax=Propionicimonas sp. TaxID=1955623 RepID=UPI002F3EB14F